MPAAHQPAKGKNMKIHRISQENDVVLLRTEGRITPDLFSGDTEPLQGLCGPEIYGQKVLLSLDGSEYINSSGVGWLLVCHKRFREAGGMLVLHSIPKVVNNVLRLLRMDQVFQMANDVEEARAKLNGESSHE
jgi:anti-anti-sigma factor